MRIKNFMKNKENRTMLIKCILVGLLPFIMCLIFCAVRGFSFFNLYMPSSYNNDVLFYFKQVEGMVSWGYPRGYFGYNESHALYGSFATWNPLLFIPWAIFGKIFGFGYKSMIACNIVMFSISLVAFVLLANVDWKSIIAMMILLALFPSFFIHTMNGLPETIVLSALILFFGMAIRIATKKYNRLWLILMFVLATILTLCRPFMIILLFLPCYYLIRAKGKRTIPLCIVIVAVNAAGYFVFSHFFASPYVNNMFNTEYLKLLFGGHFSWFFWSIVPYIKEMLKFIRDAFGYGLTAGTQYFVAMFAVLALVVCMVVKRNKKLFPIYITFILTIVGIIGATLIIGNKINEGGRHLYAFSVLGMILCACVEKRSKYFVNGLLAIILMFFIARGSLVPTDYDVPMPNSQLAEAVEDLKRDFEENGVAASEELSWDNTLIWGSLEYNELYSVPKGMGINLCLSDYLMANFDSLKAKYISVDRGGILDEKCKEALFVEVAGSAKTVFYRRY